MNRRDAIKALALAPVIGMVPGTVAAAKPFVGFDPACGSDWSGQIIGYTTREFQLTVPGDELIKSIMFFRFVGNRNTETYRGFAPGELRLITIEVSAKPNRIGVVTFEHTSIDTTHAIVRDYEVRSRQNFADLPDGEFVELWHRERWTYYLVDRHGNRIG